MRGTRITIGCLAVTLLVCAWLGATSALATEVNNFIEPPFGSFGQLAGVAVDQANGNVYASESYRETGIGIKIFNGQGGEPVGGIPQSIEADTAFLGRLYGYGLAVDPSSKTLYVAGSRVLNEYHLNGTNEYEYVCVLQYYGGGGDRCQANGAEAGPEETSESTTTRIENGGVATDSAGDLYVGGTIGTVFSGLQQKVTVFEFNQAGEAVRELSLPRTPETGEGPVYTPGVAVTPGGAVYVVVNAEETGFDAVFELKRSSLTGAIEGEPAVVPHTAGAQSIAFDNATGELIVGFATSGEELNGAHEVVGVFGAGVMSKGGRLAVDEATGEIYLANPAENAIDRFAKAVPASAPTVDAPAPTISGLTRTSGLLAATVATGDATTRWHLEYVTAGEYEPAASDPYAAGGSTPYVKLAPAATADSVGPVPLSGLLPSTTYHYRLVATNELGTTYGPDHTFTTAAATPPLASTGAPVEVTQTGVVLTGTVDTRGLQTSYEFEVGTDTSYSGAKLFGNAGASGVEAVSASLQFLIPGTTYHYRLVASNQDGTTYGQDITFTTPPISGSITQPVAEPMLASPVGSFPSVAGAITKRTGHGKAHVRTKHGRKRHGKRKHRRG